MPLKPHTQNNKPLSINGMTPRQHLLSAVEGREVDPVPIDVMENRIYPKLEADLLAHFGLPPGDHVGCLEALGSQMRWANAAYIGPTLEDCPLQPESAFPAKKATRSIWGSWAGLNSFTDEIDRPFSNIDSIDQVHAHRWPDPDWFDYARVGKFEDSPDQFPPVEEWAKRFSDYARMVGGFNPVFSRILDMCGMQQGLFLMAARPDLVEAMVGHIADFLEEFHRRLVKACGDHVDFMAFGDDFAGQDGMLIDPDRWRRLYLPVWKRLFAVAHDHGLKVMFHSCGSVRPVLGDLIDAGMDVFEVVQITAHDMDPVVLKNEFGNDVTFYGGVDTQQLLPRGSEQEVRDEVRRLIDIFGKGGRFILSSMHLLMDDVPARNVLAMFDEVKRSGREKPS